MSHYPCQYYKVAHSTLGCCEWTDEGCGKHLWERTAACVSDLTAPSLVALLLKVYDACDTEVIDIAHMPDLWPHCPASGIPVERFPHTLDGFLHLVWDDEPTHLCTSWSLPIHGVVYCIDLWIIQVGEREIDASDLACITIDHKAHK